MKRFVGMTVVTAATLMAMASQFIPAAPTQAAANVDQRVKVALDKAGWKYTIDKDGDFKVGLKMQDGRTQVAYILSNTHGMKGLQMRRIFSVGYTTKGELSGAVANQLLKASSDNKFGAWGVTQAQGRTIASFVTRLSADMTPEELDIALLATLYGADAMEERLTGKDRF